VIAIRRYNPLAIAAILFFIAALAISIYLEFYPVLLLPFAAGSFFIAWQQPKLFFFFLLFLIPFSIELQLSETLATDFPDEMIMIIVAVIMVCSSLFYYKTAIAFFRHPIFILVLIWFSWMLVTTLLSAHPFLSFKYLLAKTWYVLAFMLAPAFVLTSKNDITDAAKVLALSMLIVTLVILIRHAGFSFRFADTNLAVTPFFRNHVNYGALLACIILVFGAWTVFTRKTKRRLYLIAVLIILLAALYFSYSRGAWLAVLAGLLCLWCIKNRLVVKAYFLILFVVSISVAWLIQDDRYLRFSNDFNKTIYHENFSEHLVATYKLKDVSTAERFYRWIAGIRMIKDRPLNGYGPNNFYENYKPYALPAFRTWVSNNSDHSTVHNYFLLLIIEQGWPGLILFLVLAGAGLYYSQYLYHRIHDRLYKVIVVTTGAILAGVLVLNFLSDLIETDKIGSLFFLCLGILVVADLHTRSGPGHSTHHANHFQED
jgi:O-antigen ligase